MGEAGPKIRTRPQCFSCDHPGSEKGIVPTVAPESNMLDWLTWPADQLLRVGGVLAGWLFGKDATSFTVVQMMFATLVLAAFVALLVFWQRLVEYCRSLWKTR